VVCEDNPSLNGNLKTILCTSDEILLNAPIVPFNPVGSDLSCNAIALVNFHPKKYHTRLARTHGHRKAVAFDRRAIATPQITPPQPTHKTLALVKLNLTPTAQANQRYCWQRQSARKAITVL
jgi:hypothetical protein